MGRGTMECRLVFVDGRCLFLDLVLPVVDRRFLCLAGVFPRTPGSFHPSAQVELEFFFEDDRWDRVDEVLLDRVVNNVDCLKRVLLVGLLFFFDDFLRHRPGMKGSERSLFEGPCLKLALVFVLPGRGLRAFFFFPRYDPCFVTVA
jgi:hypothetical protein